MLKLFISTLRGLHKCCPWLHWPLLDRLTIWVWLKLVERDLNKRD